MANHLDSTWARRGFLWSTRIQIYKWTVRANRPLSIPEAICKQNPSVTMEQATAAFNRWREAMGGNLEGTARYGRGEIVDGEYVKSTE